MDACSSVENRPCSLVGRIDSTDGEVVAGPGFDVDPVLGDGTHIPHRSAPSVTTDDVPVRGSRRDVVGVACAPARVVEIQMIANELHRAVVLIGHIVQIYAMTLIPTNVGVGDLDGDSTLNIHAVAA